ncbi:MAG: hypothetical protein IJ491_05410 [Clostridia bacterium]|nr:hypothetical protein [Clostridia bacterium]
MSNMNESFKGILSSLNGELSKYGFEEYKNENGSFIVEDGEKIAAFYQGDKGTLKLEYSNGILGLYAGDDAENANKRLSASLLSEDADAKDVKYVVSEIAETLHSKFGTKNPAVYKKPQQKAPQTVSKNAVKNGSFYDANTLASKLCLVFPELRPMYKENLNKYGEFFGEEFFEKYGTKKIIDTIKENNPQNMKKLFHTLNEIYEDGTTAVQGLIAVTILGELNNDQILLSHCVDYMSETMAPPVIEVNRYLASASGKKAKKKLLNPPAYKPKKEKKPGLFAQAMAQSGGGMPPM